MKKFFKKNISSITNAVCTCCLASFGWWIHFSKFSYFLFGEVEYKEIEE